MIPTQNIVAWSKVAPWSEPRQVEQDLIIARALVELFNDPFLRKELRFRGGTALNKLHFPKPLRYSEDIDLVRTTAGAGGGTGRVGRGADGVEALSHALARISAVSEDEMDRSASTSTVHLAKGSVPKAITMILFAVMTNASLGKLYLASDYDLAAGTASRWTQGAGVVKALHPFCQLGGAHRTFIETHLAKSRRTSRACGAWLPHVFTTSYLTHEPIEAFLARQRRYGYEGPLVLSPGRAVGLRLVPMVRDLQFAWEEMPTAP